MTNSNVMDSLYVESELVDDADVLSKALGTNSSQLKSVWDRLNNVSDRFSVKAGVKVDVDHPVEQRNSRILTLAKRDKVVCLDLSRDILLEVSLLLESDRIVGENAQALHEHIESHLETTFHLKQLPIVGRGLLGGRTVYPENIKETLTQWKSGSVESPVEVPALRSVKWDTRFTDDVVSALKLLRTILEADSCVDPNLLADADAKEMVVGLALQEELVYEHAKYLVEATSILLSDK